MQVRMALFTIVVLASSRPASAYDLRALVEHWTGYNENAARIVMGGLPCTYTQMGEGAIGDPPRITLGFRTFGCPQPGQMHEEEYQFIVSRVIAHKDGNACVFECRDHDQCLLRVYGSPRAAMASISMFEARPGSCESINTALEQIAPAVEADIAAAKAKVEQEKEAQRAAAAAAQKQAEELADSQQKALKDCGPAPSVSGGPWFAPSYKVGALNQAQAMVAGRYLLCVKQILYVGPDVNPFGGNAAKANFTGYDLGGQPKTYTASFFY